MSIIIPLEIVRIEDEQLREQAMELWLSGLTDQELQEVGDTLHDFIMGFVPFIEAVGEACREVVSCISEWVGNNPEVKAYLESLE